MTAPTRPIFPGLSVRPVPGADGAALVMNTPTGTVSLYLAREDWQTLRNTAGAVVERLEAQAFVGAAPSVAAGLSDA